VNTKSAFYFVRPSVKSRLEQKERKSDKSLAFDDVDFADDNADYPKDMPQPVVEQVECSLTGRPNYFVLPGLWLVF